MAITPEQADEVFIVLVSCGMEAKVTNVTRKAGDDGHCQVSACEILHFAARCVGRPVFLRV